MAVRRVEVTGPARPVVAWERYADLDAWSTWAPQIRGVDADGTRLAVGRTGVVRALGGLRVPFVVTAVDEPTMRWSWVARVGPVVLSLHHEVAPADGGTRAGLVLEGPTAVVAAYAPLTRIALARLVAT
ncbi:SRPBCC family protein [Microlunatus flavus]|uniref:Polyketide cyclase / dehydrase and lipid transport n=1 Tax=Microlunatus flavus TaxID=1036181 RepID=A0A1H9KHE0_9ACTN|nr:SRPBCC family protein [Microlunatus flavus]SEQ98560.1 Polyketide cyclase / dehydrase and lipid transport [Microlunatus flavus]